MTDTLETIAAARAGCPDARGELLEAQRPELLRVARHAMAPELRVEAGASDMVQVTISEAYVYFKDFEGTRRPELMAWLRGLLLNNVRDLARRLRADKRDVRRQVSLSDYAPPVCPPQSDPAAAAALADEMRRVEAAMRRLPTKYREAIELHFRQHLPLADVAAKLGTTAEATRKQLGRALDSLRKQLGVEDADGQRSRPP